MNKSRLFVIVCVTQLISNTSWCFAENQSPTPAQADNLSQPKEYVHIVESGQSLSAIASAYRTTKQSIMVANKLRSATVRVGQRLIIPAYAGNDRSGSSYPSASTSSNTVHVIESGQSLSAIALAYRIPMESIMAANNLKSARVRVGQRLIIPTQAGNFEPESSQVSASSLSNPSSASTNTNPTSLIAELNLRHQELTKLIKANLQTVLDSQEPEVALSQLGTIITDCNEHHSYFLLAPAISAATNNLAGRQKIIETDQAVAKPDMQDSYRELLQQIKLLLEQLQRETSKMQILRNQMTALSEAILDRQKLYKEGSELLGAGPARESLKAALRPIAKAWMTPQLKQTGQN